MTTHTVKTVQPLDNFILLVGFNNGETKLYDVKPLFDKWGVFNSLADIGGLFEQVRVDVGGYGIVWNDDIDLSCDELWDNGTEV